MSYSDLIYKLLWLIDYVNVILYKMNKKYLLFYSLLFFIISIIYLFYTAVI